MDPPDWSPPCRRLLSPRTRRGRGRYEPSAMLMAAEQTNVRGQPQCSGGVVGVGGHGERTLPGLRLGEPPTLPLAPVSNRECRRFLRGHRQGNHRNERHHGCPGFRCWRFVTR